MYTLFAPLLPLLPVALLDLTSSSTPQLFRSLASYRYTLCFLSEGDDHPVQLGPYTLNIKSYSWGNRGKNYVATSYPEERGYSQHEAASKIQGRFRGNRGKKAYRARRN